MQSVLKWDYGFVPSTMSGAPTAFNITRVLQIVLLSGSYAPLVLTFDTIWILTRSQT